MWIWSSKRSFLSAIAFRPANNKQGIIVFVLVDSAFTAVDDGSVARCLTAVSHHRPASVAQAAPCHTQLIRSLSGCTMPRTTYTCSRGLLHDGHGQPNVHARVHHERSRRMHGPRSVRWVTEKLGNNVYSPLSVTVYGVCALTVCCC